MNLTHRKPSSATQHIYSQDIFQPFDESSKQFSPFDSFLFFGLLESQFPFTLQVNHTRVHLQLN